jgi:hypothetical protein
MTILEKEPGHDLPVQPFMDTLAALFHIDTDQHVRLLTARPLSRTNTGVDPQTGFA